MNNLESRIAILKQKLINNPRLNPPIGLEKVVELENKYEIELPAEYKAFITTVGDGGLGLLSLECSLENPVTLCNNCLVLSANYLVGNNFFRTPFIHTSAYIPNDDPYFIELQAKCDRGEITQSELDAAYYYTAAGTMIISDRGCGYYERLVITGSTRGQIWGDGEVSDQGYIPRNVGFLDWYENG